MQKFHISAVLRRFLYNERQHLLHFILRICIIFIIFIFLGIVVDFRKAHQLQSTSARSILQTWYSLGIQSEEKFNSLDNFYSANFKYQNEPWGDETPLFSHLDFRQVTDLSDYYGYFDAGLTSNSSPYPFKNISFTAMLGNKNDPTYSDQFAFAWGLATADIRSPLMNSTPDIWGIMKGNNIYSLMGEPLFFFKVSAFFIGFAGILVMASTFITLPIVGAGVAQDSGESGMKAFLMRIGIHNSEYWTAWVIYAFAFVLIPACVPILTYPLNRLPFLANSFPVALVFLVEGTIINLGIAWVLSLVCKSMQTYSVLANLLYAFVILLSTSIIGDLQTVGDDFLGKMVPNWVMAFPPILFGMVAIDMNMMNANIRSPNYTFADLFGRSRFQVVLLAYTVIFVGIFTVMLIVDIFRYRRVERKRLDRTALALVEENDEILSSRPMHNVEDVETHPIKHRFAESAEKEHHACEKTENAFRKGATVVVSHLNKSFPPSFSRSMRHKLRKQAPPPTTVGVANVSFQLRPGVTALLAKSGGGKSVTINCLSGVYRPTSGNISFAPGEGGKIGLCPQSNVHWDDLTVDQHLRIFQSIYSRETNEEVLKNERIELLELMDIHMCVDQAADTLSGGQQRRLSLALALIGKPTLCIIDEISSGLDRVSSRQIQKLIVDIAKEQKRTILITTHSFEEATRISDDVAIIQNRELAAKNTVKGLVEMLPSEQRVTVFWANGRQFEAENDVLLTLESRLPEGSGVSVEKSTRGYTEYSIACENVENEMAIVSNVHEVFNSSMKNEHGISTWSIAPLSLKEVMLRVFGEDLDQ